MTEGYEPRGVENPRIIDLIFPDPDANEVVLAILERRPWGSVERQLHQLEDKLNSYFSYVLDGFLTSQYPDYTDLPVRIQLDCATEPGEAERPFLRAAARFAVQHGMRLVVNVVDDPEARQAPWEE